MHKDHEKPADRLRAAYERIRELTRHSLKDAQRIYEASGPEFQGCKLHRQRLIAVANAWPDDPADEQAMQKYHRAVAKWNDWRAKHRDIVELRGLDLSNREKLMGLDLSWTDLSNARLMVVDFSGSSFDFGSLENSDLVNCTFNDSRLVNTDLSGAKLARSRFERADFSGATGVRFDENLVRLARIESHRFLGVSLRSIWRRVVGADNHWFTMMRIYSGSRYLLHLVLLAAFLTPFAIEAAWLLNQGSSLYQISATSGDGTSLLPSSVEALSPDARISLERTFVIEVLSGWHEGPSSFLTTIVFLVYHGARAFVTSRVTALREEFEPMGTTPSASSYGSLYTLHVRFLSWFQLIALLAFCTRIGQYLTTTVLTPVNAG
ncbi:MAG: pentapeptide repeat-containing protein [Pseudomonadota bacterium]